MITPQQIIEFYGNKSAAGRALGLTSQAIHFWVKQGRVPELWQYKLAAGFPAPVGEVAPPVASPAASPPSAMNVVVDENNL